MSPGVRRRDWVITKELLFFYIKQVDISDECYMSLREYYGGGGKKLGEAQRSSSRSPWKVRA